ncbi:response regulator [Alteraurantiacibacter aquimixticola]|uniref:Response regulator n=1 Tax=Alteraurantiacibacter aquimixticola TaxID=2489173 RepID=A0A4T3EZE9_9SPHN|nr:response regulator [Alteraurantiacibacter aquimixticola]TIX50151.1 response regulator [Alteraurantiacibacter aquimixticola]
MSGGLKKILYVEDDDLIAELATMAMEDFGELAVRHCSCGAEALEAMEDFGPDLILLDVMMPQMDGLETLRRLRTLPGGEGIPAIFMSARVQTHERDAYIAEGACGVIAKPFDPLVLADTLREMWAAGLPASA